jgi:hypothetical protein
MDFPRISVYATRIAPRSVRGEECSQIEWEWWGLPQKMAHSTS